MRSGEVRGGQWVRSSAPKGGDGGVCHGGVDPGVVSPVVLVKHSSVSHRVEQRPQSLSTKIIISEAIDWHINFKSRFTANEIRVLLKG